MSDNCTKPVRDLFPVLPDQLPLTVAWSRAVSAGANFPLAYHLETEIQFVKQGQGSYFIQDRNYPFKMNSLIVIRPNEIHRLIPNPGQRLEKGAVIFSENLLDDSEQACFPDNFPHHICLSEHDATDFEVTLRSIIDERNNRRPLWQNMIKTELMKLVLLIKRTGVQNDEELPEPENRLVEEMIKYIETNFAQDLTLNFLADRFALSPSYLSHLFKKCTGLNLKHYVLQRRIVEAKKLLESDPKLKISAIPHIVGFHDFPVFNRNFRQVIGLTPSAYRKIMHEHSK
ncbi:MAG: AraC family transcriptional regulator [bacterium]|nr:AraC family transcriptional regulator [bacterium]